jgi:gamma-tubulin complex component 4
VLLLLAELLDVYRAAVLQLQQREAASPLATFSAVRHHLSEFTVLLPALHELTAAVESERLAGGRLLHLLHSRCHCGIPALHSCLERLMCHCNQVLYRQLAAW